MKAEMRVLLQAAGRVQVFNQAHPVNDQGLRPPIEQIDQLVARANQLIAQQAESAARSKAANRSRRTVRDRLVDGLLRLFAEVARAGAEEVPELRGLRAPNKAVSDPSFVANGSRLIEAARQHLDSLGKFGITSELVEDAAGIMAQFETISREAKDAYQARVEARKALYELQTELSAALSRLDRLNRHRFAEQPDVLARWETARHPIGPAVRPKPETPSSGAGGDVPVAA